MGKKVFYSFLLGIVFLLASCGTADNAPEEQDHSASPENSEQEANQENALENNSKNEEENGEPNEKNKEEAKITEPAYHVTPNWFVKPKEDAEDAEEKVVLMTIDDAPDENGVEIAEKLDELDVPAIFFVNGHFLQGDEGKEQLKKIDELGFPIGNHTMTHEDLTTLTEEEQKEEILDVNEAVEDIIGKKPEFFRAPFGKNTDYSKQLVEDEDMLLMNWTYGYDFEKEYQDADALEDIMVNTDLLSDGAILLMHDRDWTNEAMPDIVDGLRDKGYEMLDPANIDTEEIPEETD